MRQTVLEIPENLNSTSMNQDFVQKLLESQTTFFEKMAEQSTNSVNLGNVSQSATSNGPTIDIRLPRHHFFNLVDFLVTPTKKLNEIYKKLTSSESTKINIPVFEGKYSEFPWFFDLF